MDNKRPKETRIELLVRVRTGLTRKLYKTTLLPPEDVAKDFPAAAPEKQEGGPHPLYAWIEGPFGPRTPIGDDVDVLVLIAGGSGISFTLPIMLDLVRRKRAMDTLGAQRCARGIPLATERITFIWTIRNVRVQSVLAFALADNSCIGRGCQDHRAPPQVGTATCSLWLPVN